jgi:hypothetical protein
LKKEDEDVNHIMQLKEEEEIILMKESKVTIAFI